MAHTESSNPSNANYRINASTQILSLLNRLRDSMKLLGIAATGDTEFYPSTIIEVNKKTATILFDQIRNPKGHSNIRRSDSLRVNAVLDGVRLQFVARLLNVDGDLYATALPDYLLYFQKRDNYRIRVTRNQIALSAVTDSGEVIQGVLVDISATGLGLMIKGGEQLELEDRLSNVRFTLPGGEEFQCDLLIRYIQNMEREKSQHIGCEFIKLNPTELNTIKHSISNLEREMLKARARFR
jgi:c-di-GMP-binding flagellar brake protein YcgR